jgi:hypothetical protein
MTAIQIFAIWAESLAKRLGCTPEAIADALYDERITREVAATVALWGKCGLSRIS